MLGQCSSLVMLNLANNDIGDEGAGRLAGVLGQCCSLAKLDLSENDIGDEGAESLAEVLGKCSSLSELDFTFNVIDDDGIAMLGACWPRDSGLAIGRQLHEDEEESSDMGD